jgi:hypothetical protein
MGNILDELIAAGIVQVIPVGYEKEGEKEEAGE